MAIQTYQDLKGSIANWLARPDIDEVIPDFITICEAQINRSLRTVDMEAIASTVIIAGQVYYSTPTGMLKMRNLVVSGSPEVKLTYLTPEQLTVEYPSEGSPCLAYTVVDGQIKLSGTANVAADANLRVSYWKANPPLTDTDNTNWLTINAPDLLLYGSLVGAEMYIVNDARMPMWKQAFQEEMTKINVAEKDKRYSGGVLTVRT